MLSSDEDDIEEMTNEYLENLARMAVRNSAEQGVNITAKIDPNDDSDDVSIHRENVTTYSFRFKSEVLSRTYLRLG